MKFRQIAKDLFQIGTTDLAVIRKGPSHWTLGLLKGDEFITGKGVSYYTRKQAGKESLEIRGKLRDEVFTGAPIKVKDLGEAKKRPAPPRPFGELLRNL